MKIEYAERVKRLPKYIFVAIEELKAKKEKEGIDFISLGIGDPDLSTPELIINELINQVKVPENQNYPASMGEEDFREAVSRWYKVRFNVDLDPKDEISNVIGGKEGVANIARAFINPGDIVLCPNPGYPVYENGATKLCDAEPISMPILSENQFLPDLDLIFVLYSLIVCQFLNNWLLHPQYLEWLNFLFRLLEYWYEFLHETWKRLPSRNIVCRGFGT